MTDKRRSSHLLHIHHSGIEMERINSDLVHAVKTDNVHKLKGFAGHKLLKVCNDNGWTLLHCAVANESLEVLQYLLEDGTISINAQDHTGNTALHLAVSINNVRVLTMLLDSGADDTISNSLGSPPLHTLLKSRTCSDLLATYVKYPVNVNVKGTQNCTTLHIIADTDNLKALELIWPLMKDLDCLQQYSKGKTPLHTAAQKGSHKVLDYVLSRLPSSGYSDVLQLLDHALNTPLHLAVENGHKTVVQVLLKHGASPTLQTESKLPPLHLACAQDKLSIVMVIVECCGDVILHNRDACKATPLHCCTKSVCDQLISFVVEHGADPNSQDIHGNAPIHNAVRQGSSWRVQYLLANGADPAITNNKGFNAFHLSIRYRRGEAYRVLSQSEHAQTLSVTPDSNGDYPIHLAMRHRFGQAVPTLATLMELSENNGLQFRDCQDNSFLHTVAGCGDSASLAHVLSLPCVKSLLNSLNSQGHTPLHLAACSGSVTTIQELLDHGAIAHKSNDGSTPFMLACLHGHLEAAVLLYEASPLNKSVADQNGDNTLHMAAKSKDIDLVLFCLDNDIDIVLNSSDDSFLDVLLEDGDHDTVTAVLKHSRWEECLDVCSIHKPHPVLRIIEQVPESLKIVLDRSITTSPLNRQHREYWELYNFKYLTLESSLTSGEAHEQPPTRFRLSRRKKDNGTFTVLTHLIKSKHQSYLVHPLITTFLDIKWRRYARLYHAVRFMAFFLFTLCLSVFIAVTPPPQQFPNNATNIKEPSQTFGTTSIVFRSLTIILAALNLIVLLVDLFILGLDNVKHFIFEIGVWLHGLTVLLTLVFTIPWEGLDAVYWQVGAVAVFLAWILVVVDLQLFSVVGIFVVMLLTVTWNVFGVLLVSFVIICAFAFPLYILLATVPDFTYTTIGTSLFSVLASLHAELDYRNFTLLSLMSQLGFPVLTFIFICLATIVMPIAVINLLIGLAVGDIARIQQEAVLSQRRIEVRALQAIDRRLPQRLMNRFFQQTHTHYPNKSYTRKIVKLVHNLWSEFNEAAPAERIEKEVNKTGRDKRLVELEESVASLIAEQTHQRETLNRIEELLKTLVNQSTST